MRKYILILMIALLSYSVMAEINDTNSSIPANLNETSQTINLSSIEIINFFPITFNIGDVQLNIQIQNNGNETLKDIAAFVTGNGFSSYDAVPIDSLSSGDKSYIIISGNFKDKGEIQLKIWINGEIFFQNVSVINPNEANENEQEKTAREKKEALSNLSSQLDELKKDYASLEILLAGKKDNNFDVSSVNLADLRNYLRNTESNILAENVDSARVNLKLAIDERDYQKSKIENAKEIPAVSRIKDYALIFTTLAGAFIMIFTLYELLKKKGSHVVSTISSVKGRINGNGKVKKGGK